MSGEWKAGFRRAVIDAIVASGYPVRERPTIYMWEDYAGAEEVKADVKRHGIDYERCTYKESSWNEFMGTFYEGDTRVYGIDAVIVIKGVDVSYMLRWRGTVSSMIEAVLREGAGE